MRREVGSGVLWNNADNHPFFFFSSSAVYAPLEPVGKVNLLDFKLAEARGRRGRGEEERGGWRRNEK